MYDSEFDAFNELIFLAALMSSLKNRSELCSWIVLLEQVDRVDGEETHVWGKNEAKVVQFVLLVEDNLVTELLREPGYIFGCRELVFRTRLESCREIEGI